MTAQEKLLKDIMTELTSLTQDPRFCKLCPSDRLFIKSARVLARRVDELIDCPQDTVVYSLVARIWHNMSIRFYNYHTH